ncbi:hypothetical protein KZ843_17730 [Pseudomonas aeruginosa]|nr:hypothetical protein [Pseudomonas aeruginosa]MBW6124715.1 hypothetical protein [Pseudomonas aeruginosa]
MNLKKIVEQEAMRAEALLAGYLGSYAGSIDLADFHVDSIDGASADLKRCVRLIQDLADVTVVSQSIARNMVNAVDNLAELVRVPRMSPPTRTLWAIEDSIRQTPLAVIRHVLAVVGAVAAGIWGTIDKSVEAEVGVSIAAILLVLSFGCSLSHLRDPDHTVPKGLLAFIGIVAVVLLVKGVLFTFLVLAVIAAGFFIRDIVEWCSSSKSTAAHNAFDEDQLVVGSDTNLYTNEELYDLSRAPGPACSAYGLMKDDD